MFDLTRASYAWLKPDARNRYGSVAPISRDYLPADYRADTAGQRLVADVHVEGHRDSNFHPVEETRWLAGLNASTGCPSVCVGNAALDREDIADLLAGHAAFPLIRGIRDWPKATHAPGGMAYGGNASMDEVRWRDGYALLERHGMSCDLIVQYAQLDEVARLARDFPRTSIIVNHMAYPPSDLEPAGMTAWRKALELIAPATNVAMKVSGMCLGGPPWRAANHATAVRDAVRILGIDRCMFGSNFPVDRLTGSFDTIVAGMQSAVADLAPAQQRKLFRDNAIRIYRITMPMTA